VPFHFLHGFIFNKPATRAESTGWGIEAVSKKKTMRRGSINKKTNKNVLNFHHPGEGISNARSAWVNKTRGKTDMLHVRSLLSNPIR
jgi:hypothetical protein